MTTPDPSTLIPVTLLTGFLGSGKTTVLNTLVRQPEMARSLIVINEFGQIGLDHMLVAHSAEDAVVEMSSGCLCCTIRGDLIKTLREAVWRFARGGARQFDRVLIETTGLADPAPILNTLMTDPFVAKRYRLDGVICTVDLAAGEATLDAHPEAVKQVAVADALLLTKQDLATEPAVQAMHERLRRLNPTASQWPVRQGAVEPDAVLNLGLFDADGKTADVARWLRAEAVAQEHAHHHHHHHDVNRHDEHIRAYAFTLSEPIDATALDTWLDALLSLIGADMLRMKAVLDFRGEALPVVLHGVQHRLHPRSSLPAWPGGHRGSQLVFITRDIEREAIEASFRQAMAVVGAKTCLIPG